MCIRDRDGTFREYAYTREIADEVVRELAKRGYVAERIVKELSLIHIYICQLLLISTFNSPPK